MKTNTAILNGNLGTENPRVRFDVGNKPIRNEAEKRIWGMLGCVLQHRKQFCKKLFLCICVLGLAGLVNAEDVNKTVTSNYSKSGIFIQNAYTKDIKGADNHTYNIKVESGKKVKVRIATAEAVATYCTGSLFIYFNSSGASLASYASVEKEYTSDVKVQLGVHISSNTSTSYTLNYRYSITVTYEDGIEVGEVGQEITISRYANGGKWQVRETNATNWTDYFPSIFGEVTPLIDPDTRTAVSGDKYSNWVLSVDDTFVFDAPSVSWYKYRVVREGYSFDGWWTAASGGRRLTTDDTVSSSVTKIYAHWRLPTAQTYMVTYNPGAYGSGSQQTATKTEGISLTLKGAIFTRTGYMQSGWSTDYYGSSKKYDIGAAYTSDASITLYPYWIQDVVTLSSIMISGVSGVTSGDNAAYTCTATMSDGTTKTVTPTWSISSGSSYASISTSGKLTAEIVTSEQNVTVQASYTEGGETKTASKTITIEPKQLPAVPHGVLATDGTYSDKVSISWNASIGATSYNLYRSTTSTRPSTAMKTNVTSPYSDTTATPGAKYYYWVSAVNSAGESYSSSYGTGYRAASLALGKTTDSYAAAGGSGSASVTANTSWSATMNVSWITLGTSSGNGNGTLTYTVAANSLAHSRSGTITVTSGAGTTYPATKSITVTQKGASDFVVVGGVLTEYNGEGGDVTIPPSVTSIGEMVFCDCRSITSVMIPSSVTSIGLGAFLSCSSLTTVTIPSSVTSIGDLAFSDCYSLSTIYVDAGDTERMRGLVVGLEFFDVSNITFVELQAKPKTPTDVVATDGAYSDKVLVSWSASSGATSYNLYRSTTSTRPSTPTKTGVTSPYSDTTAAAGMKYYYWVSAVNSAGEIYSTSDTGYRAVSLSLGTTAQTLKSAGGQTNVSVTANTEWYASADVSWIAFTTSSGYGKETLLYTVAANASAESRTGTISVTAGLSTSYPVAKSITVIQEGTSEFEIVNGVLTKYTGAGGVVTIPEGVSKIGERAFYDCNGLISVSIPSSVTSIGSLAFSKCSGLTSVTIPEGVTSIGERAFFTCSGLMSVTIPPSVTSIGSGAFYCCDVLTSFSVDTSNSEYSSRNGLLCTKDGKTLVSGVNGDVEIPSCVTNIDMMAFYGCSRLTSVTIPSSVTSIGLGAFWSCSRLVSVTIPSSVTNISYRAFSECDSLTTIYVDAGDTGRVRDLMVASGFDVQNVTFIEPQIKPEMPINVAASDGAYSDKVSISWTASSGATSYNLFRSTTLTRPSMATMTGVTSPYSDTTVTPGTKYYYWVSAVNSAGASYSAADTGYRAVSLSLGDMAQTFESAGGSTNVSVTANTDWSASVDVGWITFTTSSGNGNGTLSYMVASSDQGESRSGTITVIAGAGTSYPVTNMVMVTQSASVIGTPVIVPEDGATFDGDNCTVTISCATPGAAIYYSSNGRTPRESESYRYGGPFTISETSTIVAFAVKDGVSSDFVEATITKIDKPLTLKTALDSDKIGSVTTGGASEWTPMKDASAKIGGSFTRSGTVGMEQTSWMETTVYGKGILSFWWKVSCEPDPRSRYTYDHLTFTTEDGDVYKVDGESGWQQKSVTFTDDGVHVVRWTYSTDDWEEPGYQDCAWVDGVEWTGDSAPDEKIEVVPGVELSISDVDAFMAKYPALAALVDGDREAFVNQPSAMGKLDAEGNQMYVWQDIVAGTDPTDPKSKFTVKIAMDADGQPVVTWVPALNGEGVRTGVRTYTVMGCNALSNDPKDWTECSEGKEGGFQYFKVSVKMP